RALDRGDRHFVEIGADGGQGGGVVRVLARGDRAEIDLGKTGPESLDRHRGKELHRAFEVVDLQLVELLGSEGGNRDGNVLQVLFALLRGNDDDGAFVVLC